MAARTTNGHAVVDGGSDDEEASRLRPVDIDQDVREMERRKRVEAIMTSKLFREELERVVSDSVQDPAHVGLARTVADVLGAKRGGRPSGPALLPVDDIRGLDAVHYAKSEKQLRCKLAAVYRLIDANGWSRSVYNHVTARLSQDTEEFLLSPLGVRHDEVTASGLVKVDMQGNVLEPGTTNFGASAAGFALHATVYSARPDVKCVMHLNTPNVVAVSAMKCGLLYLSHESCLVGDVSYHNYEGLPDDRAGGERLARDLGVHNKVVLLRHHGALCCGETVEEAFFYAHHLSAACDTQVKMLPHGLDNLHTIDEASRRKTFALAQLGAGGPDGSGDKKKRKWAVGELDFEALMRMLDNAGYRTGYNYKMPLVKEELSKPKSDVEVPPAVSSLGYLLEEEHLYKDGPLRALLNGFSRSTKDAGNAKWMNSPNVYQKVEVLETGTTEPKKITKWVADGSPSHSTPIKLDSANHFVPLGTSKKEFKKIQAAMKEGRRAGGITAGPESKVLEGLTWEEARILQESNRLNATADSFDFKVGAASKGIIQRDFQHHATVFRSAYAKNPFDNVSAEELAEYQRIIDTKSRQGDVTDSSLQGINGSAMLGVDSILDSTAGDHTYNGEETDGNRTFSEGEGDTSKATDTELTSPKKEKKKKTGLRTPSFLKKKKKDKDKEKKKA